MSPLEKLSQSFKTSQGQLSKTSTEEMSALASKSNQMTTPQDPMSGAALGGTPQQAAMSGSRASLRAQIRQSMDLTASKRQGQGIAGDQTAAEEAKKKADQLQTSMGQLDTRVQNLVDAKLKEASPAPVEAKLKINQASIPQSLGAEQKASLQAALEKLAAGGLTPAESNKAIYDVNMALGKTGTSLLSADDVNKMFMQGDQQIGDALKAGMANTLKMSQVSYDQIQLKNPDGSPMSKEQLANTLGLDVASMDNMSVSDFMGKLNDWRQKTLTRTQQLQNDATNPLLGPAERQEARMQMRGAGATGLRTAEESVADLKDQIKTAEQVRFNGQDVSVENLLKDESLAGIVRGYLNDPNSPESQKLKQNEPGLAQWVEANKAGLDKLSAGVSQAQVDFGKLQQEYKDLANTSAGVLNKDQMAALGLDPSKVVSELPQKPAILEMLNDKSNRAAEVAAANLYKAIGDLHKLDKDLGGNNLAELRGMSRQEIEKLGLTDKAQVDNYVNHARDMALLTAVPDGRKAVETALNMSISEANQKLVDTQLKKELGLISDTPSILSLLDTNGDGKIDLEGSKDRLLKALGAGASLQELLRQGKTAGSLTSLSTLGSENLGVSGDAKAETLFSTLKPYIQDRNFGADDAEALAKHYKGNVQGMYEAFETLQHSPTLRGQLGQLQRKGTEAAIDQYKNTIFSSMGGSLLGGDGQEYGHWANRMNDGKVLPENVRKDMEKAVSALDSAPANNLFEQNAKKELVDSLRNTIMKSRENADMEARRAAEEARKRAEAEAAEAAKAAAVRTTTREMSSAYSKMKR